MANNVAGHLLVYALLLFFMVVAVFLAYAIILHGEQTQLWSSIKERGADPYTSDGQPNYWYYIVRDMDKIRNMTDVIHMDHSMNVTSTPTGFLIVGKDFEIRFERVHSPNNTDGEEPQPEDYTPTIVKRKTYVWEMTKRRPAANISVPVFLDNKHDKTGAPPFQNTIPGEGSDGKRQ